MSGTDPLSIRPMNEAEMALSLEWAAREGWNPGLSDAHAFRSADPAGFLMAVEAGEPVGCISVVAYGKADGFLGLFITREDRRGRGIGAALWQAGMARMRGRSVGLDGVLAQQGRYARDGFVLQHRNIRFAGPRHSGAGAPVAGPPGSSGPVPLACVRPVADADMADLSAFDTLHFGVARPRFLAAWLSAPGHVVRLMRDGSGQMTGYGVLRRCREGFKIGPLFAGSAREAQALFDALVEAVPVGALVVLDVPEPNAAALALASAKGLVPVFETARMVKGRPPALPLARIFGITSFELG